MPTIDDLRTPALLLDLDVLEQNLRRMADRAKRGHVRLRPHIKTHKCFEIGKMQRALGASGITVSTLYEAEQFATAGFDDITYAVPLSPSRIPQLLDLQKWGTVRALVDSREAAEALASAAEARSLKVHVWLKVDCGSHRAGVDPASAFGMDLARCLSSSKSLVFDGILTHAGHSYGARTRDGIRHVAREERDVMVGFAERLRATGIEVPMVSIGSTPTMSVDESLEGVSEIRPGNYVFFDYTQASIGSCEIKDCALTVLASVISHQAGSSHFVTDAGALALSKDLGPMHLDPGGSVGHLFADYGAHKLEEGLRISSVSQEHGVVKADAAGLIEGRFAVGDRVRILENHSCLTAAEFDEYVVLRGKEIVDRWKILRGRD